MFFFFSLLSLSIYLFFFVLFESSLFNFFDYRTEWRYIKEKCQAEPIDKETCFFNGLIVTPSLSPFFVDYCKESSYSKVIFMISNMARANQQRRRYSHLFIGFHPSWYPIEITLHPYASKKNVQSFFRLLLLLLIFQLSHKFPPVWAPREIYT